MKNTFGKVVSLVIPCYCYIIGYFHQVSVFEIYTWNSWIRQPFQKSALVFYFELPWIRFWFEANHNHHKAMLNHDVSIQTRFLIRLWNESKVIFVVSGDESIVFQEILRLIVNNLLFYFCSFCIFLFFLRFFLYSLTRKFIFVFRERLSKYCARVFKGLFCSI